MTGRERVFAMMEGREVDHLPLMPITMMFAGDLAGVKYREYVTNFEVLAEAQIQTAETFGFDYVSAISDPTREAPDCGAALQWFDNQPPAIDESNALLQGPDDLRKLSVPDPLGGGRMHDRVKG
ncbi:MAG: uroporphyrinogen decarboxylase family protein, partial [Candidatus Hydrogenedentota bacterium]